MKCIILCGWAHYENRAGKMAHCVENMMDCVEYDLGTWKMKYVLDFVSRK